MLRRHRRSKIRVSKKTIIYDMTGKIIRCDSTKDKKRLNNLYTLLSFFSISSV